MLQLASMQGLHSMCVGAPILLEELEAREQRKPTSNRPAHHSTAKERT